MEMNQSSYLRFAPLLGLLAIVMASAGCGSNSAVSVRGKVFFENQPLKQGLIVFHPDPKKENQSPHEARGMIEDGEYELKSDNGANGASPGWYKVTVRSEVPSDPKDEYSVPKSVIPNGYAEVSQSNIWVEVSANPEAGGYDIKLVR